MDLFRIKSLALDQQMSDIVRNKNNINNVVIAGSLIGITLFSAYIIKKLYFNT